MMKYLFGGIILIILVAGGHYAWTKWKGAPEASAPPPAPAPQESVTSTYATSTFSITYPKDFTVDATYAYEGVPKKPIAGVKFTIPVAVATGTNLSSDTYISVEWLPRAKSCTGDIYIPVNVKAQTITENGIKYSVASSTGAAAGNRYEEQAYALASSTPCIAVRYFFHSTETSNYEPGTVRLYDRDTLLRTFNTIRYSLTLTP